MDSAGLPFLRMQGIRKEFPGVLALDNVALDVRAGEVHVLLGENGAGKSTLMKILCGAQKPDSGKIWFEGQEISLESPRHAQKLGIGIIHQELMLVPELTVAENIFLGREPRNALGVVDHAAMNSKAAELLNQLAAEIHPGERINGLRIAKRQLVEIAKALSLNARLLVMDEPTSALTDRETASLFDIIRKLTAENVGIIYISHRLEEIFKIGDRVTVLRDGQNVAVHELSKVNRAELIAMMVSRELDEQIPRSTAVIGDEVLSVSGLSRRVAVQDINFNIRAGEIVGVAGLLGAGRSEMARLIFGMDIADSGEITIRGKVRRINSPRDAIRAGIGFVTEDRKGEGLVLIASVKDNICLAKLRKLSRLGVVRSGQEAQVASSYVNELKVKTPSLDQMVLNLSGGNQQKIVLAKWLACNVDVLILDEPTRGIDVGSKHEIYTLMNRLAAEGIAIVLISSELKEIIGLADRVLVMRGGRICGRFAGPEATQENILACAVGT
jgi:ribose transport system ATP-binding protein